MQPACHVPSRLLDRMMFNQFVPERSRGFDCSAETGRERKPSINVRIIPTKSPVPNTNMRKILSPRSIERIAAGSTAKIVTLFSVSAKASTMPLLCPDRSANIVVLLGAPAPSANPHRTRQVTAPMKGRATVVKAAIDSASNAVIAMSDISSLPHMRRIQPADRFPMPKPKPNAVTVTPISAVFKFSVA